MWLKVNGMKSRSPEEVTAKKAALEVAERSQLTVRDDVITFLQGYKRIHDAATAHYECLRLLPVQPIGCSAAVHTLSS